MPGILSSVRPCHTRTLTTSTIRNPERSTYIIIIDYYRQCKKNASKECQQIREIHSILHFHANDKNVYADLAFFDPLVRNFIKP